MTNTLFPRPRLRRRRQQQRSKARRWDSASDAREKSRKWPQAADGGHDDDDDDHHHHHLCRFIPPGLLIYYYLWHRERRPFLSRCLPLDIWLFQLCPLVIIQRRPWTVDEARRSWIVTWGGSACALCLDCFLFPIIDQWKICIIYRSEAPLHLDGSLLGPWTGHCCPISTLSIYIQCFFSR